MFTEGLSSRRSIDRLLTRIDPPYGTLRYVVWRTLLVALTIGMVAAFYYPASALTVHRGYDLMTALDRAVPFVPWTWWIYFPHYVFGLLVTTIAVRDVRLLFRVIFAILLGQLICSGLYLLLPSTFPRPPGVGDADPWTTAAILWFWGTDPANNTFPSAHVANATLAAIGAWTSRQPVIRWYATLVAVGVFVTVHTTKQHYWIDAVGGVVVAFAAFCLALKLWPLPREFS